MAPADLEDHLLEVKKKEVEKRNKQNESKAEWTSCGFVFLILAMTSGLILMVMSTLFPTLGG